MKRRYLLILAMLPFLLSVGQTGCPPTTTDPDPEDTEYEMIVDITGDGTVYWSPPGPMYAEGTVVTLTAEPWEGASFEGWGGDASGTGTTVTVTMNSDKYIYAYFKQGASLYVSIAGDPENCFVAVSPMGDQYVDHTVFETGTSVNLWAYTDQDSDWRFVRWSGDASGTDNEYIFTIDEETHITAVFENVGGEGESETEGEDEPVLSVTPASQTVPVGGGSATFEVSNTGSGSMSWSSSCGADWITLQEDSDSITAVCAENTGESARTGQITVTAPDAIGSPTVVTVVQNGVNSNLTNVTVDTNSPTIRVWDHGFVIDGDRISVTVNGVTVIPDHTLVGPPGTTFTLNLNDGPNTIVVTALNEGDSPPNTASFELSNVTEGNSTQEWNLNQNTSDSLGVTVVQ